MPMKHPPHPGGLVRDNLDEYGLSVAAGAEAMGVTRQQLHNVISGRSAISAEMAIRLEKAFGGTADQWLRMQAAHDLARVRQSEKQIAVKRLRRPAA
jgi:addiction module HigA family antidote